MARGGVQWLMNCNPFSSFHSCSDHWNYTINRDFPSQSEQQYWKEEIAQPTHAHTYVHICIWFLSIVTYPQWKKGAKHFGIVYCINFLGHVLHLMLHTKLTNQNWTLWINWRLCSSSFSIFLPSFSTIYLSIFVRVRVCFAFVILFFFSVCLFVCLFMST